jgi:hypothetical protein
MNQTIEPTYVTFEQAKLLKEIGFEGIEIDYKNKLVFNTYLAKEDFTITEGNVTFKVGTPMFVHDNGGYNEETVKLLEYFK